MSITEGICHKGPLAGLWRDEKGIAATIGGRYVWRKDWLCWGWEPALDVFAAPGDAPPIEIVEPVLVAA